jgi:hypothetical protein
VNWGLWGTDRNGLFKKEQLESVATDHNSRTCRKRAEVTFRDLIIKIQTIANQEETEALQFTECKSAPDRQPLLPGNTWSEKQVTEKGQAGWNDHSW